MASAQVLTELAGTDAEAVFGPVDSLKLRSSMTLFARSAPDEPVFQAVLDHYHYFAGEADAGTVSHL